MRPEPVEAQGREQRRRAGGRLGDGWYGYGDGKLGGGRYGDGRLIGRRLGGGRLVGGWYGYKR